MLKQRLWNPKTRWFDFQDDKGRKDTRYTVQMFKLFGSKVLDAEEEAGLLGHLNSEKEFLSEFGLHSMSKTDPAYDQVDIDNGGGGRLHVLSRRRSPSGSTRRATPTPPRTSCKRILWWGERMPYWGDSIVADKIDYRKDTPLQCTIDGVDRGAVHHLRHVRRAGRVRRRHPHRSASARDCCHRLAHRPTDARPRVGHRRGRGEYEVRKATAASAVGGLS